MKHTGRTLRATFTVLSCVWLAQLLGNISFAQTIDPDRAARIREQMGAKNTRMVNEADLISLRGEINKTMEALTSRIVTLETEMVDIKARIRVLEARTTPAGATNSGAVSSAAAPAPAPAPAPPPAAPAAPASGGLKMNVSMCAGGCDAAKFDQAVALIAQGGTLTIEPGIYFDCIKIHKSMKIVGKIASDGSRAHLKKTACSGKAAIDLDAPDVTVQGLKISDITVPHENGACIRVGPTAQKLLIKDIICLNSENGVLGGANNKDGVMTIEDSYFEGHGKNGFAHGLYINGGNKAILRNVKILASNNGHLLKTGAKITLVENSVIASLEGNSGEVINAYGGGQLTVRNSVLQLGRNAQNHNFISYAVEPKRIISGSAHKILIENNWIIYDDANRCCRWLFSKITKIPGDIDVRNNKFVGRIDPVFSAIDMRLNKEYQDRDAADLRKYDGKLDSMPAPGA
ncbi:MAG: hypothetical protein ACOY15_09495 [Pseudomonadota bacterium]